MVGIPDNPRLRSLLALAVLTLAATVTVTAGAAPAQAATTTITVDGGITGRTFDGVGAISGGGGNSRLLIDYPPTQRAQILDYLFKPGYGAAVQLLKLEIGGDANSTDGAEPSHQHVRGDINCNVGYEFWLGEQAIARNPNIKLVALPWTAPGWIGNDNFWTQDMIDYDISWLTCAKQHGLTINYLGGWNERGHDSNWYKNLRTALNNAGYSAVQIVGDDSGWGMADEFAADPTLKNAVGVLGNHYVCGYLSHADSCSTTTNARTSGKPLWASEFGSQDDNDRRPPLHPHAQPRLPRRRDQRLHELAADRRDHPEPALRHRRPDGRRLALVRRLPGRQEPVGQRPLRPVHPARLALPEQLGQRLPGRQPGQRQLRHR